MRDIARDAEQLRPPSEIERLQGRGERREPRSAVEASSLSRSPLGGGSVTSPSILPDARDRGNPRRYPIAIVVGMTVRHRRVMQVAAGGAVTWRSDDVSTEEPLEIRVG